MDKAELAKQLIEDEDLRLKPYRCTAGYLTIGVGRNLDANGITKAEAMMMLENDITSVANEMYREFPWSRQMSDKRQQVLANMLFNLGLARLKGFKRMLACLKEGKYNEAAEEMLASKWAKQVGIRAARLASKMRIG